MRDTHTTDPILADILAFCERHNVAPSRFGADAVGDRALVTNLKDGREVRSTTRARIKAFMDGFPDGAPSAAR